MPARAMGLLCALGAGTLLAAGVPAPAGAVPRVVSPVPEWLAPGAELALRVRPDITGVLTFSRRVPGGTRQITRRPVKAGRVLQLTYTPARSGRHDLMIGIDAGPVRRVRLRVRPVSLVALGDVSPGSAIAAVRVHGPAWHWQRVGPWLRDQDVVVANWETATGPAGPPWPGKAFNFLAPPDTLAAAAREGGVDAMSLANNHALDHGRTAFVAGLRAMAAAGIAPFGGGRDLTGALAPAIIERGGLRIALLGFNAIQPIEFWAAPGRAGNAPATPATIDAAVRAARARVDLVITFMHWGIELDTRPDGVQRTLADAAFAAGADVVLGAHPHVLQPVEVRGRRLVAWSLGNFLFSPGSPAGTRTGALRIALTARGVVSSHLRRAELRGTRPEFTGP